MAQKLLTDKLLLTIHIALFLLVASFYNQATAQSVLLPGDVVIVSANADTQSIDFIPLIDIEEGTSLYFSNGLWDDSTQTLHGSELHLYFNEDIQAGTNIHVNSLDDQRISASGELTFEGGTHRLFTYQKENDIYRFIFGLGWGKGYIWSTPEHLDEGSDIPGSLKEGKNVLLTLGEEANHQYYIRNGASGTRDLLLKFAGNPANWRGSDSRPFPAFGTSFNLLTPPVIFFDQSVSTVLENDSVAVLNVAIYGHNGSRLSVDVVFDSLRSIASLEDFNNFKSATLNFTGLVGDAVYEVRVPINDDSEYEGRETGIFTLKNLTKGNYGDFLTHSLLLQDDELPEILISNVENTSGNDSFVEIRNMEDGVVSLSGWSLSTKEKTVTFSDDVILFPNASLKWHDAPEPEESESETEENAVYSKLEERFLNQRGGSLVLKNFSGEVIDEKNYPQAVKKELRNTKREEAVISANKNESQQQIAGQMVDSQVTITQINNPGWKIFMNQSGLKDEFPEKDFYIWNEKEQQFEQLGGESVTAEMEGVVFGYFETGQIQNLKEWTESSSRKEIDSENLKFTASVTDKNENELIDGLEGLNLVFNNINDAVYVYQFLGLVKSEYPEISLVPIVYSVRQNLNNELDFMKMSPTDEIAPNAPFWIMLDSTQTDIEIVLPKEKLNQIKQPEPKESPEETPGVFEISFTSELHSSEVLSINFTKGDDFRNIKDLNSYPGLFLGRQSFLNAAFKQGGDYFSELTLSSQIEQPLSLPVTYSILENTPVTLSISAWEEIPADWIITLEDQVTDKEYNLRPGFSVTFEHSLPGLNDDEEEKHTLESFSKDDRFIIHITPPKAEKETEEELTEEPRELELHQNFPNPFNPVTTISFYLPESEEVRLSVFNIVGQPVAVITEGVLSAGEHHFEWDAEDKPSGMYIYQLEVGKSVMTRKMTLVK